MLNNKNHWISPELLRGIEESKIETSLEEKLLMLEALEEISREYEQTGFIKARKIC